MTQSQPGEMIERLEVAARNAISAATGTLIAGGDHFIARAVLTAMREPTPGMKMAGAKAITLETMKANANYDAACDCWEAVLDHILTEREG